jgi:hypothetical protein
VSKVYKIIVSISAVKVKEKIVRVIADGVNGHMQSQKFQIDDVIVTT